MVNGVASSLAQASPLIGLNTCIRPTETGGEATSRALAQGRRCHFVIREAASASVRIRNRKSRQFQVATGPLQSP